MVKAAAEKEMNELLYEWLYEWVGDLRLEHGGNLMKEWIG